MLQSHRHKQLNTQLQVYYRGARKGNQGHRMQENPSAALAPPRTYSDPQTPGWWGGGWLPKKPHLALGIRAYRLSCSPLQKCAPSVPPLGSCLYQVAGLETDVNSRRKDHDNTFRSLRRLARVQLVHTRPLAPDHWRIQKRQSGHAPSGLSVGLLPPPPPAKYFGWADGHWVIIVHIMLLYTYVRLLNPLSKMVKNGLATGISTRTPLGVLPDSLARISGTEAKEKERSGQKEMAKERDEGW